MFSFQVHAIMSLLSDNVRFLQNFMGFIVGVHEVDTVLVVSVQLGQNLGNKVV